MGRYMRRYGAGALKAAFCVVGLNLILDVLAVMSMADDLSYHLTMSAISLVGTFVGSYFGARTNWSASAV